MLHKNITAQNEPKPKSIAMSIITNTLGTYLSYANKCTNGIGIKRGHLSILWRGVLLSVEPGYQITGENPACVQCGLLRLFL